MKKLGMGGWRVTGSILVLNMHEPNTKITQQKICDVSLPIIDQDL